MSSDLGQILESKRAFRKKLAGKPIAEKLRIIEELAERTLATRKDTSAPLPDEPWPVPSDWRWSRMGDVAIVVGGSTPRTDREEYFGGEIPWITPADLSGYAEKTISRGARNITQAGYENSGARLMPANTILFSSRAPIGYVAIAANPVATNQGFKNFVLGEKLLPDFVYYYLQRAKEFAVALASGTTFLEISGKNAARLPVPIPPLPEQRRIVAEIEKQFTRLEAGVVALRRVQVNLKRYRAAVLKAACEGRLVPTEAELAKAENRKFETGEELLARILAERRKNWLGRGKYKEPTSADTTKLNSLPEGWAWATFPQLGELNRGKSKHRPRDDARLYGGPYPFIQTGDVRKSGGTIREHKQTYSDFGLRQSHLWPEGTLCITIAANIAETGILKFPSCFPDSVVGFICDGNPTTTRYAEFFIRTAKERLAQFAPATAQKNINLDVLQNVAIPFPPLAEQTRIVAEVERRLSVIEELEATVSANLQRATRLRQSILQKAFSGELSTRQ